jgi:hypothetical protein
MLPAFLVLLACLLVCAAVAARVFVRLARQLARTGTEVETLVRILDDRFLPRAESMVGQTTLVIRELESVGASFQELGRLAEASISPIGDVTVAVEAALEPFARTAAGLGLTRPRVRALGSGVRAAWSVWTHLRGGR